MVRSDRKSLEEKSRISLSLRPKSVTFVCKGRNTGMVVLKWDAYVLLSTHAGAMWASESSSNMLISLALIGDKYCHRTRRKKTWYYLRNFVVLYHGSCGGIIPRKSWYYTLNSWYYPSALLVGYYHKMHGIIQCSSCILPAHLNYKTIVSGIATHSHRSVWSRCAACSHSL